MADRMAAEIHIGGPIPADIVQTLCGEIDASKISADSYDGPWFEPESADDLLAEVVETDGILILYDVEASAGRFTELEDFLERYGITYDRFTEGKYGELPYRRSFRPGLVQEVYVSPSFEVIVEADKLYELYDKWVQTTRCDPSELIALLPKRIPALTPITIQE